MERTETESGWRWRVEARAALAGAASGVVAGLAMGVILQLGTDLLPLLGAIAGEPSVFRGWIVHLVISLLYGVVFAVIVAYPPLEGFMDPAGAYDYAFGGIIYAAMVLGAGVAGTIAVLPFVTELPWVGGSAGGSRVPGPALVGLLPAVAFALGHLVYGAVLGVVYAYLGETAG